MKTAKELHAIATKATDKIIAHRRENALRLLADTIFPQMMQAAEKGQWQIIYHVSADYDIGTIMKELECNGYEVKKKGNELTIVWFLLKK